MNKVMIPKGIYWPLGIKPPNGYFADVLPLVGKSNAHIFKRYGVYSYKTYARVGDIFTTKSGGVLYQMRDGKRRRVKDLETALNRVVMTHKVTSL